MGFCERWVALHFSAEDKYTSNPPTVQLTESMIIQILMSRNGTLQWLLDPLSNLGSYVICLKDYYMPVSTTKLLDQIIGL